MMTRKQTAQYLRSSYPRHKEGLLALKNNELWAACQSMGLSARGERSELIERLHREIFKTEYDA